MLAPVVDVCCNLGEFLAPRCLPRTHSVNRTLMRWIPGCPLMGGNSSQLRPWSNVTGPMSCGRVFPRLNKPSSGRNRVPCRGCPSLLFPIRPPLGSLLSSSASCFFVACRPLDVLGHHRAACSRAGVLGSWGFSLESAAAQVCREAGAWVSTNLFVRDLDLPIANHDARRLEVVAHGLPLFGGAQLAVDTTLVSSVQADGGPRPQCARVDGGRKQRTYPELSGTGSRAVGGVGRRGGARAFVSQLAKAKARAVPRVLAGRARQAWQHRWSSRLGCSSICPVPSGQAPGVGLRWGHSFLF